MLCSHSKPNSDRRVRFRFFLALGILLTVTLGLLVGSHEELPLAPVIVFEPSYAFPPQRISLFAQWVPSTPSWAWLWHLKEKVCGKNKAVEIDTDIIAIAQGSALAVTASALADSEPTKSGAVRVWLLDSHDLDSLRPEIRHTPGCVFLNSPRITTGDGIGASLFSGNTIVLSGVTNEIGIHLSFLARIRQDTTDLLASMVYVDTLTNETGVTQLRTNLDVKARFQIPKAKSVLILQSDSGQTNGSAIGVILSTKL